MSFHISALDIAQFKPLLALSEDQLAQRNIVVRTADKERYFPCRVSLEDAAIGEKLLLLNFEHLPVDSPYRSNHAIYVRRGATPAQLELDQVPELLRSRMLSVRGFDNQGIMIEAEISDGRKLESAIDVAFKNPDVAYLH
ncbi:MAG: DUF1203 domain-containing protein, partial [Pseudomonadota bacterium]